jgi:hypothetical protein
VKRHPDVGAVFDLWAACDGRAGVDGLGTISTHAAEAFDVVASARAARAKADADAAQKEAARGSR